jgi:hypothetical protein
MSRFKVTVMSDEPMKAWERLDRAGVPTLGPAYAEFVGSPESGTLLRCMTAVLDADNPDEAVTHVRQAVGEIGEVGAAAPLDHRG